MIEFDNIQDIDPNDLKTSKEWYESLVECMRIMIMDPDGWDRKNYQHSFYEERITFAEFNSRLNRSTVLKY